MTDSVAELRAAVDAVRAALVADPEFVCPPELVRDHDGRYILLDALAALVIAETKAHAALTVGPGQTLIVGLADDTDRQTLDAMADHVAAADCGFRVLFIAGAQQLAVADRTAEES